MDGKKGIKLDSNAAVAGATVQAMLNGQLGALDSKTDLVTITVGGNDIGWSQTVTMCVLNPDQACAGAVAQSSVSINKVLPSRLDAAFRQVRAAAPNAHIVVTGYPRLFTPQAGAYTGQLTVNLGGGPITLPFEASVAEQRLMNAAADNLNVVLRLKAAQHRFQFVDVTKQFDGHGVNSKNPRLFGVHAPVPFHPNVAGQEAYAQALSSGHSLPGARLPFWFRLLSALLAR